MTTRPVPVAPEWLVPGAKVVVCTRGTGTRRVGRGEIAKITTHTFTVTGFTQKFSVKHQDHHEPGVWGARTWVVPQDSPEGQDLLARKGLTMANAEKLWESFDDILAHRELWNQGRYIEAESIDSDAHWTECGTTQCIAGFRCLRDGLRPAVRQWDVADDNGGDSHYIAVLDAQGELVDPRWYAARQFELDCEEQIALFNYYTDDTAELKERIQEIIDGKWR